VAWWVPDFPHEIHVELFRNHAELARELLRGRIDLKGLLASKQLVADCISNELVQVKPVQHRADGVVLYRDRKRKARLAIVVEVQNKIDRRKAFTWPLYVSAVRARHKCPTYLLVFALKPRTAKWAKASIAMGHPNFHLKPLVLSPEDVPKLNLDGAADSPELAVLRALAQRTLASAEAAMKKIRPLSGDPARQYLDAILAALPAAARTTLEGTMEGYVYKSEFARKYLAKGRRDGRKKGMEKGMAKGLEKGIAKGKQDAVLEMAQAKLGSLTAAEVASIRAILDEAALSALIVALMRARSVKSARAALEEAQRSRAGEGKRRAPRGKAAAA
jgi:hypothetical protein